MGALTSLRYSVDVVKPVYPGPKQGPSFLYFVANSEPLTLLDV